MDETVELFRVNPSTSAQSGSHQPKANSPNPKRMCFRINMVRILFKMCFLSGTFPYVYNSHSNKYVFSKWGVVFIVIALSMSPIVMFTTFTKSLLYTSKSVLEPWFFYGGTLIQLNIVISRIFKIKRHFYLCSQVHKVYLEHERIAILMISLIDFSLGVTQYRSVSKSGIELFYQLGYSTVNLQFCTMCNILDFAFIHLHKTLKQILVSTKLGIQNNKESKDALLNEKRKEILELIDKFKKLKVLVSQLNNEYKPELLFLILIYMNYIVLASHFLIRVFQKFTFDSLPYPCWKMCKFAFQTCYICFSCQYLVKNATAIPRLLLQFNLLLCEQNFLNVLHLFLHSLNVYKIEIKVMRIVVIDKQLILMIIAYAAPFIALYAQQIKIRPTESSAASLWLPNYKTTYNSSIIKPLFSKFIFLFNNE
ncbi:hypothetical protein M8J75_008087 [Diaphorina citri]|nr:hypothetical protein M8J75_008087 [Diaphorina citri]